MIKYLFRQNLRQSTKYFKSFASFWIISLLTVIFSWPFIYRTLLNLEPHSYIFQISVGISSISAFYVFWKNGCCFRLHPATVHFSLHTKWFNVAVFLAALVMAFKVIVLSLVVTLGVFIATLPQIDFLFLLSVFSFFCSCLLLKWLKYKATTIAHFIAIVIGFCSVSIVFIFTGISHTIFFLILQFIFLILTIVSCFIQKLDWGKYLKDITYHALLNHASSNNNLALTAQITMEHIAEQKRFVLLDSFSLTKKNVLFYRNAISIARASKMIFMFSFLAIVLVGLLGRSGLFTHSVGGVSGDMILSVIFVSIFINCIRELYCGNLSSLLDKQSSGLFLPYSGSKILQSFYIITCTVTAIFIVFVSLLFQSTFIGFAVAMATANITMVLSLYSNYKARKSSRWLKLIFSTVCFFSSIMIVGG